MNNGSRLWIISDEISINRLTKPSTQMPDGIRWNEGLGGTGDMEFRKEVTKEKEARAIRMMYPATMAESQLPGWRRPIIGEGTQGCHWYGHQVLDEVISSSPCLQS